MKYPYKNSFFASVFAVLFSVLLLAFNQVQAQSEQGTADSDSVSDANSSASEIRIRQAGTTTVKEFHQQGKIYKVEVAPENTPAYILSDQDGNGSLNSSDTSIDNDLVVPEWTIGNW